ncbi:MAG: GNAT family N-acetyltransferase [Rhodothermales bacterium]|nr:GNAT family N-acetyltransferase [Rhodothermales bacterium]
MSASAGSSPTVSVVCGSPDDAPPAEGWSALLTKSSVIDPAFLVEVARILGGALRLRPRIYLAGEAGKTPLAGAIIHEKRRGPFRLGVVPAFTSYTPWLVSPPSTSSSVHGREAIEERLLEAIERDFDQVRLHLPPSVLDMRPFQWRGWTVSVFYTYRITLTPAVDPEATWSASIRRHFRTVRQGFDFREETGTGETLIALSRASYARHNRRFPADPGALAGSVAELQRMGFIRIFTVRRASSSEVEAAVGLLFARDTAYYWMAGSIPGEAMTVLLGQLLGLLRDEGVTTFDFAGANTPTIAEFKRRFGGVLTPYFTAERIAHPMLKAFALVKSR